MKKSVRSGSLLSVVCAGALALGACSNGPNADGVQGTAPKFKPGFEFIIVPQGLVPDDSPLRNGPRDAVAIPPGGQATMNWSVENTGPGNDACTISGPNGFSQQQPGINPAGLSTGTLTAPGIYRYTLECSGPGGVLSETRSLIVGTPDITISVTPDIIRLNDGDQRNRDGVPADGLRILDEDQAKLTWSSILVEDCVAAGTWEDTATPTNNLRFRENLSGFPVGPFTTPGIRTYTLNCVSRVTGSTVSVTRSVNLTAAADAPTLDISVSPSIIRSGQSALLRWQSTAIVAGSPAPCTASGNAVAATPTWTGAINIPNTAPAGISTGAIGAPGVYRYTLSCTNASGTVTDTAELVVLAECGLLSADGSGAGLLAVPGAPSATVSSAAACISGLCDVDAPLNVVNASLTDFATMSILLGVDDVLGLGDALGLNSTPQITVNSGMTLQPNRPVGFIVRSPAAPLLGLNLLQNVTLRTLSANGAQVESSSESGLDLDLLGLPLIDGDGRYFVSFQPTREYQSVRLEFVGILAAALPELEVYGACVGVP